jgi:hypothetical protein
MLSNVVKPIIISVTLLLTGTACAKIKIGECTNKWIDKSDAVFAKDCADMAFSDDLKNRQKVAWMFFARINQLIEDTHGVSQTNKVPQWMAWATDDDTFTYFPDFEYKKINRADLVPVTRKDLLAGGISKTDPDGSNEEVTRNFLSYEYLTKTAKLNTKLGVLQYLKENDRVEMPVGTVELKASWVKVPTNGVMPENAMTFEFESGTYWWRGIHIMVKMKTLSDDVNVFYSEEPSWFWTTFEFTNNPGVSHVREKFITQNAPLTIDEKEEILDAAGISGFGFEAYTPNGTQIRFTENGDGKTPVILGHTDMEDFAGFPNIAQPSYWSSFNSSCHSCHASASINTTTNEFFPFSVPSGALTPQYNAADSKANNIYLGDGFKSLDFMWPITFRAK